MDGDNYLKATTASKLFLRANLLMFYYFVNRTIRWLSQFIHCLILSLWDATMFHEIAWDLKQIGL